MRKYSIAPPPAKCMSAHKQNNWWFVFCIKKHIKADLGSSYNSLLLVSLVLCCGLVLIGFPAFQLVPFACVHLHTLAGGATVKYVVGEYSYIRIKYYERICRITSAIVTETL